MTQIGKLIANSHRIMSFLISFTVAPSGIVTISLYNLDGDGESTYSFSNIAKMIEDLRLFNIKSEDGIIKDLLGNKLKSGDSELLGGKEPSYYKDETNRFKFLINTEQTGFPERWMAGVTFSNDIMLWGRMSSSAFKNGLPEINASLINLPHAPEKVGVNVKALYSSTWSLYVLYEDGDLYVTGLNNYGQLGIGNTISQYELVFSASDVKSVHLSSVGYHQDYNSAAIIKNDNSVWLVGYNGYGQLGNGNTVNQVDWVKANLGSNEAKDVLVLGTNYISIFILTTTGKVYSSGYNGYGQLGDGSTANRNEFKLLDNMSDREVVKMVGSGGTRNGSSAYYHISVMFLTNDGRVFGQGYNGYGQLGVGNTVDQHLPVEISYTNIYADSEPYKVIDIFMSKGSFTSSGYITNKNDLYMQGYNGYGQLGIGNTVNQSLPVFVSSDIKNVKSLAGGTYSLYTSYIATKVDDSLSGWGYNAQGQLGVNHILQVNTPEAIRFNYKNIKQISFGGYSNKITLYILLDDGILYSTGDNDYYQSDRNTKSAYITRLNRLG